MLMNGYFQNVKAKFAIPSGKVIRGFGENFYCPTMATVDSPN